MFGLEDQKKKKQPEEFVFDLEKELKSTQKQKEVKQKIESKIQRIKEILRTGEEQDEFDRLGVLLNGYNSLLKVISRLNTKK